MRRLELVAGTSSKFWELEVEGSSVTTRWGRIGSAGRQTTKSHPTAAAAQVAADKQLQEKLRKGYAPPAAPAAPAGLIGQIEALSLQIAPGMARTARPPADPARVRAFEAVLGADLPSAYRTFLIHATLEHSFDGGYTSLRLAEVWQRWETTKEQLERGLFDGRYEAEAANGNWDDGRIVGAWWHPLWVPVAQDGCGNQRCIDLWPGPNGWVGQLIDMEWQGQYGPCVGREPSFQALLRTHLDKLHAGSFEVEDDALIDVR